MSDYKRLAISFSGGRSSAVMLHECLKNADQWGEISIVFANTGCEHPATLDFVDAVDREWCRPAGIPVVWIEAEIHGPGKGPTAKVVTYETVKRNGEPFEEAIKKHGIFCKTHPQCTSRLKEEPMNNYRRKVLGWKAGTYETAIGIRADELDRVSSKAKEKRLIYPLVDAGWTRNAVNMFMNKYDWDLGIPHDGWGNCTWCWKKSIRKLMTVAKEDPSVLDFPKRMEAEHGWLNKGSQPMENPRVFFRENRSAEDVLKMSQTESFTPYRDPDQQIEFFEAWDVGSGCGESCEIGADE